MIIVGVGIVRSTKWPAKRLSDYFSVLYFDCYLNPELSMDARLDIFISLVRHND